MSQNRRARRRRAALLRRTRRQVSDLLPVGIRTFTVGALSIDSVVLGTDDSADSTLSSSSHDDCPFCRAIATLEEYEAAMSAGGAPSDLEERAKEAMLLLSGGTACD